jgi:AcrR family transcriptional regulator
MMGNVRITKKERYAQLIDCATQVFAEKGYSNATTKDISEKAQVSEKLIYLHFKSKKELFLACFHELEKELIDGFSQVIVKHKDNPLRVLKQYGLFFYNFIHTHQFTAGLLDLRISDVKNDPDILKAYRDLVELYVGNVEKTIRLGAEKGMLPSNLNPRALAWLYVGSYNTFLMMEEFNFPDFNLKMANELGKILDVILKS